MKHKKTFFYGKQQFGVETGRHHLQKKNGHYHKIFYNLYLEEETRNYFMGNKP